MDPYAVRLGTALRTMREELGLTQDQLADMLGVRQPYVSRWERGEPALKLDTIEEIEDAVGKQRGYLLRLAGYVVDGQSVAEKIAADPRLGDDGPRQDVLIAYREGVKRTSKNRRGRLHG